MTSENLRIVLEAASWARQALGRDLNLSSTQYLLPIEQQLERLRHDPLMKIVEQMQRARASFTMPDIVHHFAWPQDLSRQLDRTAFILPSVADATKLHFETAASVRQTYAELGEALRTVSCSSVYERFKAITESLPHHYRDLMATQVLPELSIARWYVAATNFGSLHETLGAQLATTLERDLGRSACLFEAHVASALPAISKLDDHAAAIVERNITRSSRTLLSSSRTVFHLQPAQAGGTVGLRVDGRILQLLRELDAGLAEMYIGAVEAYNKRHPDWPRHVGVSLRELADHLLKVLAPSDAVAQWLRRRGARPDVTRRTRIQFIRKCKVTEEIRYLDTQLNVLDELCAALNAPTHERKFLRGGAMRGYIKTAEGCLLLILENRRRPLE